MSDANPPLVRLADVHVTLESTAGPVKILRGIDLSIAAGSSVSVVGPSGSGKSTLLAVVGGIERPTSGEVRVGGQDFGALDEDRLAVFRGRSIGILFQQFHLIPTMTALENVAVPMELAGVDDAFERAEAGLRGGRSRRQARALPGPAVGWRAAAGRAGARALANQPALLLADEPTGNLDQATGHEIVELIFRLQAERAMTLLLITHERALAARCDRRLRMADGRLHEEPQLKALAGDEGGMNGLTLAWRLAQRELRGGLRGFGVFLACLTLGVAAIAAVGVINAAVIEAGEARRLRQARRRHRGHGGQPRPRR